MKKETRVIKATDYRPSNNMSIPMETDVLLRLEKGDYSYTKF